jgi:hypothetical protein
VIRVNHPSSKAVLFPDGIWNRTIHFLYNKNENKTAVLGQWSGYNRHESMGHTLENHKTRFASSVASLDLLMFPGGLR